ncbi:reductive dehalogenase [Desulfosporosinus orientis DSM 765]|uniref:Reductive dehalogenase n=1 Tax=Desulfosporosinus orientis (strain ATCC 19365 / DSM 765 / NCIMB 8382 / VKM B-1628 / Singapore I) TaxID=768706 RepID=G7W9F8_DESOD|nr:reductive dehalogenase [Desulfosporosinus orientis]AET69295.1 reductive dehalogenase [Desulfosporosinus orientis DSM 765]
MEENFKEKEVPSEQAPANQTKSKNNLNRRQFLLSSLGIGVATAVGATIGVNPFTKPEEALAEGTEKSIPLIVHDNMPIEIAKDYKRFNQKNTIFCRFGYDPEIMSIGKTFSEKFHGVVPPSGEPGFTETDAAVALAAWSVDHEFATNSEFGVPNQGLYAWEGPINQRKPGVKDAEDGTSKIKKAAKFLGASLVGIADYDDRWVYSEFFNPFTGENSSPEFSFEPKHVIVMAIEMDYESFLTAPTLLESAAAGLAYSHMAETAHKVATFIRQLGYQAIPCGNDTAISPALGVQAGLGELGRNGLLITPQYGPRVRLCKVFTDMPMNADKPITFGVERFCETCMKCADSCPSKAISRDKKPSMQQGPSISNNPGVRKWAINPEKCFKFWSENGGDCGSCIASCPYNKLDVWHHELARTMAGTPAAPMLRSMDDLFGFGKVNDTQEIKDWWKKDTKY